LRAGAPGRRNSSSAATMVSLACPRRSRPGRRRASDQRLQVVVQIEECLAFGDQPLVAGGLGLAVVEHLDLGAYIDSITLVCDQHRRARVRSRHRFGSRPSTPAASGRAQPIRGPALRCRGGEALRRPRDACAGRRSQPRPRRLNLQIAATAVAARVPMFTANPVDFLGADRLVDVVPLKRLV
jgi:hypothetical protein